MHAPRPYGLAVYGGQLTDDDLAFIDSIAKHLTNIKGTSKIVSLKLTYDLPDGGAVVVYDMGGVFRAIANKPQSQEKITNENDYIAKSNLPMLYSGAITRAIIGSDEKVAMNITSWTTRRLTHYDKNRQAPKRLELERFDIAYHNSVQEFEPNPPPTKKHTQYARQRPTWYSGSMAKVMQIVGGYGRQDLENLPNNEWEQASVQIPKSLKEAIEKELGGRLLPAYTGYPPNNGQYQYDYKHTKTNAVAFDNANNAWLLQISRKGVYAMPLPIIPATATTAYRKWVESVGDVELLAILDEFGALPSGENFPDNDSDWQAWERAGAIIKICDTADFYSHSAYSTACGWSLNTQGTDGYNTCYDYNNQGVAVGYTYNLTLSLVGVADNGRLTPTQKTLSDEKAEKLAEYLAELGKQIDDKTVKGATIRYKLRRHTDKQLYDKIGETIEYWDNLVMPPIAPHTGKVRQVYQGLLYSPIKSEYQPQMKFAEPLMGVCVSFDFGQLDGYPRLTEQPKCDTVMWAYFADDDLKVVKYYYDTTTAQLEVDSNFEAYMTVGSFYETVYSGASHTIGNFYHSDLDDRDTASNQTTETTIRGEDKGYDTKPFFAFDAPFWQQGTIWRNRYFTHLTKRKSYGQHTVDVGLCVPFFVRDGVIYASKDNKSDVKESEVLKLYAVKDPTTYRYWTYDSVMHWRGGPVMPAKGKPYPKDSNPVWVEVSDYAPHPSNAFADNGDWLGGLPKDMTWLIHPDSSTWWLSGGGGPPIINEYSMSTNPKTVTTGYVSLSMYDKPKQVHKEIPNEGYFINSPDKYGNFFYREANKNLMGDTEYSNVSEKVNGKRKYWGNSQFVNGVGHDTAHHFIGVISE